MGFVAKDYALSIWGLRDVGLMIEQGTLRLEELFSSDMLGDDLEAWLDESSLMKRTFRDCAMIGGLIERQFPGQKKTGRQVTFSADLIFDVLRSHQPDHVLLQAARAMRQPVFWILDGWGICCHAYRDRLRIAALTTCRHWPCRC